MARKFIELPSLSSVAAGSRATLAVPLGNTYHKQDFDYSGVDADEITDIKVKINGKTIQEYDSVEELNAINAYYGRNVEAGRFTLWYDSLHFDNAALRRTTAIGTADVSTFQVSMKIAATAAAPEITAIATVSPNTPLGMIRKVKGYEVTNATAGLKEVADIPREGRIPAMFLFKNDITSMEVSINSNPVYEMNKVQGEKHQRDYDRVPDGTAYTAVDFNLEGDPMQGLVVQGVNDFRVRPVFGSAGSGKLMVEYLTQFAGI